MQKMPFNLMFIFLIAAFLIPVFMSCTSPKPETGSRAYNGPYTDAFNTRVAWPIGGIGAGMICLEGRGAISHVSVRNRMEFFNEPCTFAAVTIKGENGSTARILEGPVPEWKTFGGPRTGNGAGGTSYGLPRFKESEFLARFPFGTVTLSDPNVPLEAVITGWSPFIPGDADNASLPVGTLEYSFKNPTGRTMDAVFSYNSKNFMSIGNEGHTVKPIKNGFVLWQEGTESNPENKGAFAVFVDDDNAVVDHCWFKGGWWDAVTLAWKNIESGVPMDNPPVEGTCPGASLFVPFTLEPGGEKTVRLMIAWYVPETDLRLGTDPDPSLLPAEPTCCESGNFVPWYAGRFSDIYDVAEYWRFR